MTEEDKLIQAMVARQLEAEAEARYFGWLNSFDVMKRVVTGWDCEIRGRKPARLTAGTTTSSAAGHRNRDPKPRVEKVYRYPDLVRERLAFEENHHQRRYRNLELTLRLIAVDLVIQMIDFVQRRIADGMGEAAALAEIPDAYMVDARRAVEETRLPVAQRWWSISSSYEEAKNWILASHFREEKRKRWADTFTDEEQDRMEDELFALSELAA